MEFNLNFLANTFPTYWKSFSYRIKINGEKHNLFPLVCSKKPHLADMPIEYKMDSFEAWKIKCSSIIFHFLQKNKLIYSCIPQWINRMVQSKMMAVSYINPSSVKWFVNKSVLICYKPLPFTFFFLKLLNSSWTTLRSVLRLISMFL